MPLIRFCRWCSAKIVYLARLHTMYGSKFTKGSDTVYVARLFFKTLIFLALGIVCCSCELLDQNLSVDALGRLFDVKPAQVDRPRRGPTTSEETAILTFQISTGPDSGKYMRVVGPKTADFFNQSLSDSDEYAYWVKNVMPYVKDQMGNIRTARIMPLSYNWDNSAAPKKYFVTKKSDFSETFFSSSPVKTAPRKVVSEEKNLRFRF